MSALPIEDMSNAYIEHSMVINNFVVEIGSQIKDSLCRDRKNVSFTGIPRFVMEVLSDATEKYDRGEKMETYCKVGVSEYWIVDWRKKSVEIYMFDYKEDGKPYSYLFKAVTEKNKDELGLVMFPNFKISFDHLFDFA